MRSGRGPQRVPAVFLSVRGGGRGGNSFRNCRSGDAGFGIPLRIVSEMSGPCNSRIPEDLRVRGASLQQPDSRGSPGQGGFLAAAGFPRISGSGGFLAAAGFPKISGSGGLPCGSDSPIASLRRQPPQDGGERAAIRDGGERAVFPRRWRGCRLSRQRGRVEQSPRSGCCSRGSASSCRDVAGETDL